MCLCRCRCHCRRGDGSCDLLGEKRFVSGGFFFSKKRRGGGGVRSIGRYYLRCTGALQIGVVQEQVGGDSVRGGGEV